MRTPLTSDSVTRINDDGTRQNFVHLSAKVRIRSSVTASASVLKKDGTVHKQRSAEPITDWLSIARHDENVAKVLRLFGSYSLDWVNLYRIYEVIESDIGNTSRIIEEGWATQKAIGRFKHTANSPSVTGDMSRHGKEPTLPPPNLMTISKAESLIRGIFNNWVRSKK